MTQLPTLKTQRWPAIDPGQLRHLIRVQGYTLTAAANGTSQRVYEGIAAAYTTWAKIDALTQVQESYGHSFITDSTHRMIVRWDVSYLFQAGMIITDDNDKQYNVTGVVNYQERNVFAFLYCNTIEQAVANVY
ncbi:MAG: head-tail adaptor protein [Patescibacteria group bacterium]|nr:head-tail adaptor protein [Patescibacteria group bacterium]